MEISVDKVSKATFVFSLFCHHWMKLFLCLKDLQRKCVVKVASSLSLTHDSKIHFNSIKNIAVKCHCFAQYVNCVVFHVSYRVPEF